MKLPRLFEQPYPEVEDSVIAVHSFHSLARETGYHPTHLSNLYRERKFNVIAFRHTQGKSVFAVLQTEVARLKSRFDERKSKIQESSEIRAELKAMRAQRKRENEKASRKRIREQKSKGTNG